MCRHGRPSHESRGRADGGVSLCLLDAAWVGDSTCEMLGVGNRRTGGRGPRCSAPPLGMPIVGCIDTLYPRPIQSKNAYSDLCSRLARQRRLPLVLCLFSTSNHPKCVLCNGGLGLGYNLEQMIALGGQVDSSETYVARPTREDPSRSH